jgi:hypothetical protein
MLFVHESRSDIFGASIEMSDQGMSEKGEKSESPSTKNVCFTPQNAVIPVHVLARFLVITGREPMHACTWCMRETLAGAGYSPYRVFELSLHTRRDGHGTALNRGTHESS